MFVELTSKNQRMGTASEKIQRKKNPLPIVDKGIGTEGIAHFEDNRPEAIAQRKWNQHANDSQQVQQLKAMQEMSYGHPVQLVSNDHQVVQRYDKENFNKIKGLVSSYSLNKELIANVDDAGEFNKKISSLKGYAALEADEKTMVMSQVKMKIKHASLDTVVPEDDADIKKNFNSLKSCVITALLYAEGGTVLGVSTVEGLHYVLYNQFPKWRQYSDDDVLAQIYQVFGYHMVSVDTQARHTLVTAQNKNKGMTASVGAIGHMVGFKKAGPSYTFRDNDNGEGAMNGHATRNNQVNRLWWK